MPVVPQGAVYVPFEKAFAVDSGILLIKVKPFYLTEVKRLYFS